jgi:hypothetical protein
MPTPQFSEAEISGFVRQAIDYIHAQRDRYLPWSSPLCAEQTAVLRPFFKSRWLRSCSGFEPHERGELPRGPMLQHITNRALFHGLVHTIQGEGIGVERAIELNVRSFLKTRRQVTNPRFAHAFQLDHRFVHSPASAFSVEDGQSLVRRRPLRSLAFTCSRTACVELFLSLRVGAECIGMLTDAPPRRKNLKSFVDSDRLKTVPLPPDNRLLSIAATIQSAMTEGTVGDVRRNCDAFLAAAANFYGVPHCGIRVLAARPLRVREYSTTELFGDYHPDSLLIRVWMKTAIRKDVTSFGTFFSTLCHEFCHHLDFQRLGFRNSWHTRGFYERTAALYHHARGTPPKHLVWAPVRSHRWRIDWSRTNRHP